MHYSAIWNIKKSMEENKIGKSILIGLSRQKMTQTYLAKTIGVGNNLVSRWVKGEATPGGDKLLKIIDLLKIHDIVFPDLNLMDNKKATKSEIESLWERMDRIEKEMREIRQEK